jgi:predicted aspartyl protease
MSASDALVINGPTILVDIGFDPTLFGPSLPQIPGSNAPLAAIPALQVSALIDTGATESCIDEQLAQRLQLPLIDQERRSGIGGTITLNIYLGYIVIPAIARVYGRFTGVHLQAGGQTHQALIGRTLLRDTLMVYDGRTGMVRLAR